MGRNLLQEIVQQNTIQRSFDWLPPLLIILSVYYNAMLHVRQTVLTHTLPRIRHNVAHKHQTINFNPRTGCYFEKNLKKNFTRAVDRQLNP